MTTARKIAITIPPDDLAAADRLAARLGRSRSWVLSEALRRFVAHERLTSELDASRSEQLRRDLQLSAEQRVREAEVEPVGWFARDAIETPLRFERYDEFVAWRKAGRHTA
ncbi:MAG TPA: ribbon-helix-helix protein, CopG family [Gemmatimonas sp.]|nr:ribbon-helix-helix protein, CopG family [Gemmatimonas sp.]